MIDESGYGVISVLQLLPEDVVASFYTGTPLTQFDMCLLAGYQYIQASVSLVCDQDTFLASKQFDEPAAKIEPSQDLNSATACQLSRLLVHLARCNARLVGLNIY